MKEHEAEASRIRECEAKPSDEIGARMATVYRPFTVLLQGSEAREFETYTYTYARVRWDPDIGREKKKSGDLQQNRPKQVKTEKGESLNGSKTIA